MGRNSKARREKKKSVKIDKKRKIAAKVEKDKQTIATIFLDESGNTGSNILDDNQPMFTLAGCRFSVQESERLISLINSRSPKEAHFKVLRRRKAGQDGIIRLMKHSLINQRNVVVELMHKRFMVVTKIVDILIEHMMFINGHDLYKNGANIGLSNLWYMCLPLYCGEKSVDEMYKAFLTMVKVQSDESVNGFFEKVVKLQDVCSDDEFKSDINMILNTKSIVKDALDGIDKSILDPSIPSLFSQCVMWGQKHPRGFNIIHDDSHAIEQQRAMYAQFMDWTQKEVELGYDRRKFSLPLKGKSLKFSSSTDYPQLQVADIIASSVAYWAAGIARGEKEDYFFLELDKLNLHRLLTPNKIWPTKDVTPKELGTEYDGGLNPADHAAYFLMRAKENPEVVAI